MTTARTDGRVARGNATRRTVLARTMEIASVEGLEGLSLGRIANELKLSKSGVFALFGSKEELQLATIRAASSVYAEQVVKPAEAHPPGLGRALALAASWSAYSRTRIFPGGCFFSGVIAEFDARSGPVHDALRDAHRQWNDYVETTLREAKDAGELTDAADPAQLAFELISLLESANLYSVLHGEDSAYDRAGRAILARLAAVATDPGALPPQLGA
ncbi:TetR/AcrR family transcriptional regulator [Streptomyces sp. A7024]|uniref:TetR/AcrR family transcriptional regulator n=1 Tax=Streptomyces coryli TaxID=1128680 RepID=A0A6G4U4L4_9ACTN|nr:TetR/AcrR family transcriptional regulator [Streptomyces coryli]NGN67114.1 TetR/AcrR family transcriptional regulator [Streptomyces coryli]